MCSGAERLSGEDNRAADPSLLYTRVVESTTNTHATRRIVL